MPIALALLLAWLPFPASAGDASREARIRAQIEDSILVGRALTLKAAGEEFLAIFTATDGPPGKGAAIILPGRGADPNRATVIRPLRTDLPEHGWATLAVQMPVAAVDAPSSAWRRLIPEAGPRIDSAIQQLKEGGLLNQVLIGHSLGARMGLLHLARQSPKSIRAFIAIGLAADTRDPGDPVLTALEKLNIPVLDIYGSEDLPSVVNSARARRLAARKAGNTAYRQLRIEGADHLFTDMDDILTSRIRAWLHRAVKGVEIPAD